MQRGLSPQDFEELTEEYDLLAVSEGMIHDPESSAEDPKHLEKVLEGAIVWIPGAPPYGDLWRDLRAGVSAQAVRLCPECFPPKT